MHSFKRHNTWPLSRANRGAQARELVNGRAGLLARKVHAQALPDICDDLDAVAHC